MCFDEVWGTVNLEPRQAWKLVSLDSYNPNVWLPSCWVGEYTFNEWLTARREQIRWPDPAYQKDPSGFYLTGFHVFSFKEGVVDLLGDSEEVPNNYYTILPVIIRGLCTFGRQKGHWGWAAEEIYVPSGGEVR